MQKFIFIFIALCALAFANPAAAALNAYLTLEGEAQGAVRGSVTQKGLEDTIRVIAWRHTVTSPRDAASGMPTGKRQHEPFTIVAPIDRSTPILYNILFNNENITSWRLDLYRPSRAGKEFQYYTIELENASITEIHLESGPGQKDPDQMTVSFTYEKITETWQDGGITAVDDAIGPR